MCIYVYTYAYMYIHLMYIYIYGEFLGHGSILDLFAEEVTSYAYIYIFMLIYICTHIQVY
jgi:hypothetical protein